MATTRANRTSSTLPATEYQLTSQPLRPRGLLKQISTALFRPALFFRTLPPMAATRQWLWVGLLILALIGFTAIRHAEISDRGATTSVSGMGMEMGMGGPMDFGGPGGDFGPPPMSGGGSASNAMTTAQRWEMALVAAASVVLVWAVQALLLSEVSMLKGSAPRLGQNLQIAIWASLPLALMAVVQLVFMAAGGTPGEAGLSGLVRDWNLYQRSPDFVQSLLLSFTSNLTLFWLWSMMLIYFGGRYALRARSWAVLLVIASWTIVLTVAPVLTGDIDASQDQGQHTEMIIPPMDQEFGPDGMMPFMDQGFESGDFMPSMEQQPDNMPSASDAEIPERPADAPVITDHVSAPADRSP